MHDHDNPSRRNQRPGIIEWYGVGQGQPASHRIKIKHGQSRGIECTRTAGMVNDNKQFACVPVCQHKGDDQEIELINIFGAVAWQ